MRKKRVYTAKRREWVKNYRLLNHDRLRAKEREYEDKYRRENKDKINARRRAWQQRYKEREGKRLVEWFKTERGMAARLRAQQKRKDRYREDPEYNRAVKLRHKGAYARYRERIRERYIRHRERYGNASREWQLCHPDKVQINWVKHDLKRDWGIANPSDVFLEAVMNYRKCLRLLRENRAKSAKNNH